MIKIRSSYSRVLKIVSTSTRLIFAETFYREGIFWGILRRLIFAIPEEKMTLFMCFYGEFGSLSVIMKFCVEIFSRNWVKLGEIGRNSRKFILRIINLVKIFVILLYLGNIFMIKKKKKNG